MRLTFIATAVAALLPLSAMALPECQSTLQYHIYLSGIHTGEINRTETWQGANGHIASTSKASILGIGTTYQQQASLQWSADTQAWHTRKFHQQVSGLE